MIVVNDSLPKGWVRTKLGEIVEPSDQKADPSKVKHVPFVGLGHIESDSGRLLGHGDSSEMKSTKTRFCLGDTLYGRLRPYLNKVHLATFEGVCSTDILVFTKKAEIDNKFVWFRLLSSDFVSYASSNVSGVQHPRVSFNVLKEFPVIFPPLPEQHRIVAKIEELFTRLDAGADALNKIKLQLKRYRQSVLKSAFEGKLTAQWREAHKGELEPASVLLERIKTDRAMSDKHKELPPLDTSQLPGLPEGWVWARVGDLVQTIQYGTSDKANEDPAGIPVVRMGNIQEGKLVFDNLKYLPKEYPQLDDFILQHGDVLFNRTNSAELVGKSAVYKSSYPKAIFASYLIRVKVNGEDYIPDLLSHYINSYYGRSYIASVVSQQVGQANVNATKLSLMPIPFLSPTEQKTAAEEIDRCLSVADEIEKVVERSLVQGVRLRQSILKRAFEGKLVPQDPNDEPAEKLLERIKAEKAQQQASDKATRGRNKRNLSQGRLV